MRTVVLAASVVVAAAAGAVSAQRAMVLDSNADRIVLVNASDGSVFDSNFIDLAGATNGEARTPIEALEVNGEVWVTDQVADRVWRFDTSGNLLGDIGNGRLNNVRGMEVVGNTLYVATGSLGNDDSTQEGIQMFDVNTGAFMGTFGNAPADISYWDVKHVGNELWVTNSDTGNDGVERFDLAGNYLGNIVTSDGVNGLDFGQQIALSNDGQSFYVGGFSPPSGVYEYDINTGAFLGFAGGVDAGTRGVFELENGEILWTNGTNISTAPDAGTQLDAEFLSLTDGNFRFITGTALPTPAGAAALGLGGLIATRRRR